VTVIPEGKLEIREGDTAYAALFSQRRMAAVLTVLPLSTEAWISLTFALTSA